MIPDIILPETDEPLPVVQLYVDYKPLFICGKRWKDHGMVLEEILNDRKLEFETFNATDSDENPIIVPKTKGRRYDAIGMGYCQKISDSVYLFYGVSTVYNKTIDPRHLSQIQHLRPDITLKITETFPIF